VSSEQIKLYYKNVLADVIGAEHGITRRQFEELAEQTCPKIKWLNEQRGAGKTPYRELPFREDISESVKNLVGQVRDGCETLVVCGIGGSALGNIALQTALNPYMYNIDDKQRRGPRFFVFDNVDPVQLASFFDWLGEGLAKTIFNVISKSGQTAETAAQFLYIRALLTEQLGPAAAARQIIATTDKSQGTLRGIAEREGFRTLVVPDGVGGRFSVLSAVGLFAAAMCGIDIDSLLAGARDMDERVSREDFFSNPAAINAAVNWHFYNRGKRNSVIMPYSYALKDMADWYRQLWAESLGKSVDLDGRPVHIGPTPIKALGTTDQHSQVQLYREGPNDKLFTFLQVENFERDLVMAPAPEYAPELDYLAGKTLGELLTREKQATEYALLEDERPCLTVIFESVDAYSVGQFIYLFEVTTSLAGALFGIDPYDQPAVELGKQATFALMGRSDLHGQSGSTYEEFARRIHQKTDIDSDFIV